MTIKTDDNIGIDFCIKCGRNEVPCSEMAASPSLGSFIDSEMYTRTCYFVCVECCHDSSECEMCDNFYEHWLASK